jgi:hypothetical protein
MAKVKVDDQSAKYKLNKEDGKKIGRGALIALGGALLMYVSELIPNVDWGQWTPLVVAMGGVLVNLGWKLLKGN